MFIDCLLETSCYAAEVGQNYSERKVEWVQDRQQVMSDPVSVSQVHQQFSNCLCVAVHPLRVVRWWSDASAGEEAAQEKSPKPETDVCQAAQGRPAAEVQYRTAKSTFIRGLHSSSFIHLINFIPLLFLYLSDSSLTNIWRRTQEKLKNRHKPWIWIQTFTSVCFPPSRFVSAPPRVPRFLRCGARLRL